MKQEKSKVTSGYPKLDEWVTIWRETPIAALTATTTASTSVPSSRCSTI